ncbi:MAG: hypothetical protein B7Z37_07920 [Verrucomicrobia bacterium 12-59-8]|nr:MAG: hypothetical protein B7Z37_07920 [Verrucomicrobia bacterium 12-59-8]
MSSICQRLTLLLASLLTAAALSSCTEGNLGRLRNVRTGAIGIGPTGGHPGERQLPHFKPESPEELRVNMAVRRGVERALDDSRAFSYVPFAKMKQVPLHLNPFNESTEVKKFAAVNNLNAVIRVWVTPDLTQQSVTVGFLTHARSSKAIATGLANAPGPVPPLKNPTARASLPAWEKTAYEATQKALAKVRG